MLLTKSDIASTDQLTAAWHQLRSIAPGTPIIETIDGTVDPAAILAVGLYDAAGKIADVRRWLLREQQTDGRDIAHHHNHAGRGKAAGHPHDVNRHDDRIRAHCIIVEEPVSWTSFCYWLELLAAMRGNRCCASRVSSRYRTILNNRSSSTACNTSSIRPSSLRHGRPRTGVPALVFITRDLPVTELEHTLRKFGKAEPVPTANQTRAYW